MSNRSNIFSEQAISNGISWQVELAVKPGELENFRALTHEMVEFAKSEPGVLIYERFVSKDSKVVYVYERFADSAAAVVHLLAFHRMFGDRFATMVERKKFIAFGHPSDELKGLLDHFSVIYLDPVDGFSLVHESAT